MHVFVNSPGTYPVTKKSPPQSPLDPDSSSRAKRLTDWLGRVVAPPSIAPAPQGTQEEQALLTWGTDILKWKDWLRTSPKGLVLAEWLWNPLRYHAILGRDTFRDFILNLLREASYEDCAAAGFEFDPTNKHSGHYGRTIEIEISPHDKHRAVFWSEPTWDGSELWVDGLRVHYVEGGSCPFHEPPVGGHWIDDRFFVSLVSGPKDHPLQLSYAEFPRILSLFIYDAERCAYRLVHPTREENWGNPCIEKHGDAILVFANLTLTGHEEQPDRIIPISELVG